MPLYMSACDALILTSAGEGSPNVVKEALACNLPVVATDVGDVRERIGTLAGCAVCGNDAPEALAAALTRVLQSEERPVLRDAVLHLSSDILAQRIIDVYKKARIAKSWL
jgi:glycosyltransferase involved in cell wall biosynthesis